MKTLASLDKKFTVNGTPTSHKELCVTCLRQPPERGADAEIMRSRIKVLDKLEPATAKVELEDAEMETLKQCVAEMKWVVIDKNVLEFLDAIKAV